MEPVERGNLISIFPISMCWNHNTIRSTLDVAFSLRAITPNKHSWTVYLRMHGGLFQTNPNRMNRIESDCPTVLQIKQLVSGGRMSCFQGSKIIWFIRFKNCLQLLFNINNQSKCFDLVILVDKVNS